MTGTMDRFDLTGRVIVVTGGAGLLGSEYAGAIVEAGGTVIVADVNGERAEQTAQQSLLQGKGKALGMALDVSSKASVTALVKDVLDRFGRIDGLVNNAAIDPKFEKTDEGKHLNAFEDYPVELWTQSLSVNITGMFLCAQAVIPSMVAQGRGAIVNISSTYGLAGPDQRLYEKDDPNAPKSFKPVVYSVTKSAVLGLTKYLAAYYGEKGIRVNTLTPGGVFNNHADEFVRRYSYRTPLGRMAQKHEYNGALLFLLSEASAYMTGANLVVDGGWTAW
ncbi:2-dehydro-3-deoxy-D-gluconate 5-dehydrogenase [Anaerolineae bacterium]|nr:2-dehydro-3-deoxy-D-gluconate 5-dehydrogenase [Anaerolineae bacterium]